MGKGYLWAAMLKTSGFVGIGMFALMLVLAVLVYHKRRKCGVTPAIIVTLAVGTLGASSWLLYQGTLSNERIALDRVDQRIMFIVDRQRRACVLLSLLPEAVEANLGRFEQISGAPRGYLRELEQPVVDAKDLDWLTASFRVDEAPSLSNVESLGYTFGGLLGFLIAVVTALLASGYLTLRLYLKPEKATDVGLLMTGAVLLGSIVWLTWGSDRITPLVFILLLPALAATLLHRCSRRESVLLLEIACGALLLLSAGLYVLSSWAVVTAGEAELRKNLALINASLPKVMRRATSLREALDRVQEMSRRDKKWSGRSACRDLEIEVGSLEEKLGNYDPQAKKPNESREFDPYRAEFELFRQDMLRATP